MRLLLLVVSVSLIGVGGKYFYLVFKKSVLRGY